MKKVVFFKSISKQYVNLKNKINHNRKIMNFLKLATTILIFVVTIGMYGYFVNVSSTTGYFLREEERELEDAKFEHSIAKQQVLQEKNKVWESIHEQSIFKQDNTWPQPTWLSVDDRFIRIETDMRLTQN